MSFLERIGAARDEMEREYEALPDEQRARLEEALELVSSSDDRNNGGSAAAAAAATTAERLQAILNENSALPLNILFPQIYGETLLYNAVMNSSLKAVKMLLEAGADPNIGNMMNDQTPLDALLNMDERTQEQEQMIQLLREHGAEKSPTVEEAMQNVQRELYWACGVDPDEVDPDNLFQRFFLEQAMPKAFEMDPDTRRFVAKRSKQMAKIHKEYDDIPEESKEFMDEAFHLLDINDEDETPYYKSPQQAVTRIKQILNSGADGVGPNLRSYESGDTLLFAVVANYVLGDDAPELQLELVKFLLAKGADPNLENATSNETALDHIDDCYELSNLTEEMAEIECLLREAGGLVVPYDEDGNATGKRGEGEGRLEKARRGLAAAASSASYWLDCPSLFMNYKSL